MTVKARIWKDRQRNEWAFYVPPAGSGWPVLVHAGWLPTWSEALAAVLEVTDPRRSGFVVTTGTVESA